MKERISVVIPTLNEEENIKTCLCCLLKQVEKPYEVIVVDNGSIDNTRYIVQNLKKEFSKENIKLRLFYHPYGNQTDARNIGIKKSNGEIIASLDAEACTYSNWIRKINEYFIDKDLIGIGGRSIFRNKGSLFNLFYNINYYLRIFFNLYCISGNNSAFRKSVFDSVNGYSGLEELRKEYNILYAKDDYYLSKKLEKKGNLKFCSDLNVTLLYRLRNRITKTYKGNVSIREMLIRVYLEIYYDYIISRYFWKINA
ncbi:MAG: glycosyltransferase family 2 protein [Nanoarchaeota archaeon]|nr:glycosyltransferase family 2 protein [Nanoarchaeota archaeon]